jgi:hypothetical protein
MDQHRSPEQPLDRDHAVRRAGRLRRTLVGSSAAASLGVAAVLGLGALHDGSTSAAGTSGQGTTQGTESSHATTGTTAPNLSSGSGSATATTSGS